MIRRNFLGAVIGSIIATKMPFIAKPKLLPFSRALSEKQIIDIIKHHADNTEIFYEMNGDVIRTTPVVDIQQMPNQCIFKLEPWIPSVDGLVLQRVGYSYEGVELERVIPQGGMMPLQIGDTLKCEYTIKWD